MSEKNDRISKLSKGSRQIYNEIHKRWELDIDSNEVLLVAMESRDEMLRLKEQIESDGYMILDRWNQKKKNPLFSSLRDAKLIFLRSIDMLNLDRDENKNKSLKGINKYFPEIKKDEKGDKNEENKNEIE